MKIEKKLGKPFAKIDFENEMTYEEIANILWAGLSHEDPALTPEIVAELIDEYSDIQTAIEAMGAAMQEAFGSKKRAGGDELEQAEWDWDAALRNAIQCGLQPGQFWDITPAELNTIIEVYLEHKKESQKSGIIAAFYSVYFARIKTLSSADLEKVLQGIDGATDQEMTDEEMLNVVKQLAKVRG